MKIVSITGKEYTLTEEEEKFYNTIKDLPVASAEYLDHLLLFAEQPAKEPKNIYQKMKEKRRFLYLLLIVAILITIAALFGGCKKNQSVKVTDTDSLELLPPPTVQEVLESREAFRHICFVDSVYLDMPREILVNILVNKGTELNQDEIVSEYMSNYEYYNNLLRQLNIQKQYAPDSIPKSSLPEKLNKDTLNLKV